MSTYEKVRPPAYFLFRLTVGIPRAELLMPLRSSSSNNSVFR